MGSKGTKTKEKILQEAYLLFAEKGFKAVTMTDICEKKDCQNLPCSFCALCMNKKDYFFTATIIPSPIGSKVLSNSNEPATRRLNLRIGST